MAASRSAVVQRAMALNNSELGKKAPPSGVLQLRGASSALPHFQPSGNEAVRLKGRKLYSFAFLVAGTKRSQ